MRALGEEGEAEREGRRHAASTSAQTSAPGAIQPAPDSAASEVATKPLP